MKPTFFATPAEFRQWLEENHQRAAELLVGFYKKGSRQPSITWPESVDQALCFGWIDGVRKSIDEGSYTIRFTPRMGAVWSAINIRKAGELTKLGLMRPAGIKAFAARDEKKSAIYSYEQRNSAQFPEVFEKQFRANQEAWDYFRSRAPWYRRTATYWVISAKREETKLKRLATLIEDSENQRPIRGLNREG
jgi:uncharacterized protein YdeI (YjbR/CyaY-like superfamily)